MFKEEVSYFKNYHSAPETIKLEQWLDACMNDSPFKEDIEIYRSAIEALKSQGKQEAEIKQELAEKKLTDLKAGLPLVTVGAVCEGSRRMDDVIHRTGWIALDIDGKDNPHIKDFRALRGEIAKIVYVAFCALSVGGQGVWALVRIKEPGRQDDYFQQLLHDFQTRGIFLDHTKGKNPNDARFYSYDPGAIKKSNFKVYDRLPTIIKPKPATLHLAAFKKDVFEYAMKVVREKYGYTFTHPGDMHHSLFQFCSILNYMGVPQKDAEDYIDKHILSLSQITSNCITGPYKQTEYYGQGAPQKIFITEHSGDYNKPNTTEIRNE